MLRAIARCLSGIAALDAAVAGECRRLAEEVLALGRKGGAR